MTSPYWAKLWIEILDDPKVAGMPDWLFRRFIFFVLAAKEYDQNGLLQPVKDLAWRLRISEKESAEALQALAEIGVTRETADGWELINFAKRQSVTDKTVAERVRRYRERHRNKVTRDDNAVDIEEEIDKESEQIKNKNHDDDNIFKIFSDNICALTPMISDQLQEAEKEYGCVKVKEAINQAVLHNARNMKYIEAILRNGKNGKGKPVKGQRDRRDTPEARRKYGEWES
jgi:DnaD/phage-associated family protein